ncbi:MAG: HIT domain-containing protein [Rhizobacter sp.]|nr:HIT domain-containing protein [Bacteriovorax sp.]
MNVVKFTVDPVIEQNSIFIKNMGLSSLYLKNDKENPWFILVPRKAGAIEIVDLNHEEQSILMEEVTIISEFLKSHYRPHKLNIGSLGNIVQQLHLHVIARYPTDRAWPGPIWGSPTTQEFDSNEIENLKSNFFEFIE